MMMHNVQCGKVFTFKWSCTAVHTQFVSFGHTVSGTFLDARAATHLCLYLHFSFSHAKHWLSGTSGPWELLLGSLVTLHYGVFATRTKNYTDTEIYPGFQAEAGTWVPQAICHKGEVRLCQAAVSWPARPAAGEVCEVRQQPLNLYSKASGQKTHLVWM